ncbi:MAG: c-type cytochrome biogenesis protein CcmI [Sterolibacterium sp.]|nr:c-type cytochrome biogenesis protein CcmI [Sterolibacterium sp.]
MNHLPFVGAATLLTLVILLWLLYPLFRNERDTRGAASRRALNAAVYRDQLEEVERDRNSGELAEADYLLARDELQRRLLQDVSVEDTPAGDTQTVWAGRLTLVLLLPLSSALLYLWLGNPAALQPQSLRTGHEQIAPAQVEALVEQLAARMEAQPDDPTGWLMLARSSKALGKYAQAAKAYEHVLALGAGNNPDVLADYADLLAVQADGELEGRPRELVEQALKLDPDHLMSLALAGSAAYTRDDYPATLNYWGRLQQLLPTDSDEGRSLAAALKDVQAKATSGAAAARTGAKEATNAAQTTLSGQVSLAPALRDRVQATDVVYISAHAVAGPRMPLAVLRARVADLPLSFVLDDSLALDAQQTLSTATQVRVEARVSRSGDATPRSNDLRGESASVAPGASNLQIVIDQLIP